MVKINSFLRFSLFSGVLLTSALSLAQNSMSKYSGLAKHPPAFQENKGQFTSDVKFLYRSGGVDLWILEHGIVYDLYKNEYSDSRMNRNLSFERIHPDPNRITRRTGHVIRMDYENADPRSDISGSEMQQGIYNYFIGTDSTKWATNVHTYSGIRIRNLYEGIDAVFYVDSGMPRYDLIIQPGADPSKIAMMFKGQDGISSNEQTGLVIKTSMGDLEQRDLFAYQIHDGVKQKIPCGFILAEGGTVRFGFGEYDHSLPLVIDPLIYSTYLGGANGDIANAVAADAFGNAYVAGKSSSGGSYPRSYPTTPGAYQVKNGGNNNVYITKLNPLGTALIYSTFIGGNQCYATSIGIDASGNAYVTGQTGPDFPSTSGSFQPKSMSFGSDMFIAKLNASGNGLVYSTYLGAKVGMPFATGIAVDSAGAAYITGWVQGDSVIFTTTPGAYDTKYRGSHDVFITKLDPTGSRLVYSTCFGGTGRDEADAIALDSSGNAYITGYTYSSGAGAFPTTPGAFQTSYHGGADAFVTKLNTAGSDLVYSTYLGGSDGEDGTGIAVDPSGSAYITGSTASAVSGPSAFPTTKGCFQNNINGGADGFVTKLNASGSGLIYSTFIGGKDEDTPKGIVLDSANDACITGLTKSATIYPIGFPVTPDAFQTDINGAGSLDAFITKINSAGSDLLYSTYIGGGSYDESQGIAIDRSGNLYIVGFTYSAGDYPIGYPITQGAFQPFNNGDADAFVTKIGLSQGVLPPVLSLTPDSLTSTVCDSSDGVITFSNIGGGTITIDSVSLTDPFHFLPSQLPLSLPRGRTGELKIRVVPLTSGPLSGKAIIFYHTSDGFVHDTIIMLSGFATSPLAFGITLEPQAISARAGDKVLLEIGITGSIDAKTSALVGLQALEISLDLNTDLLTPVRVSPRFPGIIASQITIVGSRCSFTLFLPTAFAFTNLAQLAELECVAYVTDTMATSIKLSSAQFSASGGTSCFALGSPVDTSIFTLIAQCGDSTVMAALRNELPLVVQSIHPNPAGSIVNVLLNSTGGEIHYELLDALGAKRREGTTGGNSLLLDVTDLPSGNYYFRVSMPTRFVATKPLIIMR